MDVPDTAKATQVTADAATRLLAIVDGLCAELHSRPPTATLSSRLESDLGLDSLARLELILRIEQTFRQKLPEGTLGEAWTVRDLLQRLSGTAEADQAGRMLLQEVQAAGGVVHTHRRTPDQQRAAETSTAGVAAESNPRTPTSASQLAFAAYAWLVFLMLALPACTLAVLLPRPAWSWSVCGFFSRLFLRLCARSFSVQGLPHLPTEATCVVAVNHASYVDGLVILAALSRPFAFVAKEGLQEHFLLRLFLRRIGSEFVDRFTAQRSVEDVERLIELARAGESLALFPEGTFTSTRGLQPFRLGAFLVAIRAQVPVVPITLRGTRSMFSDDGLPRRVAVEVIVSPPIAPQGNDWNAVLRLRNAVRKEIVRHCDEPDLG